MLTGVFILQYQAVVIYCKMGGICFTPFAEGIKSLLKKTLHWLRNR